MWHAPHSVSSYHSEYDTEQQACTEAWGMLHAAWEAITASMIQSNRPAPIWPMRCKHSKWRPNIMSHDKQNCGPHAEALLVFLTLGIGLKTLIWGLSLPWYGQVNLYNSIKFWKQRKWRFCANKIAQNRQFLSDLNNLSVYIYVLRQGESNGSISQQIY